jgi:hypothetical protein
MAALQKIKRKLRSTRFKWAAGTFCGVALSMFLVRAIAGAT